MNIDPQKCILRHPHPSIDLEKWQNTVNLIAKLANSACGTIVQFRNNEFNAVTASDNQENFLEQDSNWPWDMQSFCRRIIETGQSLYVPHAVQDPEWQDAPPVSDGPVRSYLGFPLTWPDNTLFGTLCAIDTVASDYDIDFIQLMEQLRDLINADLALADNYEEIKSLAIKDEMTQAFNRRGLMTLGEQRIKDAQRFKQDIGFIFLDIDNLKKINDTFGHAAGDTGIIMLVETVQKHTRGSDILARIGGDEFVLMLLLSETQNLQRLCKKITHQYEQALPREHRLAGMSVSYGHCNFSSPDKTSLTAMITQVDEHMYEHKKRKKANQAAI